MRVALSLIALIAAGVSSPATAQTYVYSPVATQAYVYEETVEQWVEPSAYRFVSQPLAQAEQQAMAAFGPFRVLDQNRAALVGITDSYSPAEFDLMMAHFPDIDTLEFVECPGTHDDRANLRLGRMIRDRGISAVVPEGGSVRSGAVELFLAGVTREIADGAEFAVHAWLDDRGRSAWDYSDNSPEHRKYLDYYREMGMEADNASRFYAMTNSVPFESALWLSGEEMRHWVPEQEKLAPTPAFPRLAYLDLQLWLY